MMRAKRNVVKVKVTLIIMKLYDQDNFWQFEVYVMTL